MLSRPLSRRSALRQGAAALGALALAAVTAGCGASGAAGSSGDVVLRVGDQTGMTRSRLEAAGLLKNLPYKIEWFRFAAAADLHEALRANAVDIGGAADSPTVAAIAAGSKIKVVAAWSNSGAGSYILVPKDSPIRTFADLAGKRISPSTRGSIAHYLVLGALRRAGLSASDAELNFLTPAEAYGAFSTGKLDAWGTWGVYAARARGQLGARVLTTGRGLTSGLYVMSATERALADAGKREAIVDFNNRVHQGFAWAERKPDDFIAWYADFTKQSTEIAAQVQPEEAAYRRVAVDDRLADQLQQTFDTWVEAGVLQGRLDLGSHVHDLEGS